MAVLLLLLLLIDVSETEEEPWCGCLAGQAMAGGLGLVLVPGDGEVQEWYVLVEDWRTGVSKTYGQENWKTGGLEN